MAEMLRVSLRHHFDNQNFGEVNEMLQELNAWSKKVGQKISAGKTKVVQSGMLKASLLVDCVDLQEVDSYDYLGRKWMYATISSWWLLFEGLQDGADFKASWISSKCQGQETVLVFSITQLC